MSNRRRARLKIFAGAGETIDRVPAKLWYPAPQIAPRKFHHSGGNL
jgi:hypothetical protein